MLSPSQVIDEYYLEVRCKLLEIAAIMDRYDRAVEKAPDEAIDQDPRIQKCSESLAILNSPQDGPTRAEKIALVFSHPPLPPMNP